jgi:hypothetical protein
MVGDSVLGAVGTTQMQHREDHPKDVGSRRDRVGKMEVVGTREL